AARERLRLPRQAEDDVADERFALILERRAEEGEAITRRTHLVQLGVGSSITHGVVSARILARSRDRHARVFRELVVGREASREGSPAARRSCAAGSWEANRGTGGRRAWSGVEGRGWRRGRCRSWCGSGGQSLA